MELSRVFEIARNSLQSVSPAELKDFRLEQAEYDETKDLWNIVVSFLVPNVNRPQSGFLSSIESLPFERVFKRLTIHGASEQVRGFYIYNP